MAVKIEREQYDVAQQGITDLATNAEGTFSCVVHVEELGAGLTDEAAEDSFRRRIPDIQQATEDALRLQMHVWKPGMLVKVRLGSAR
jgi:hypothetical protein